MKNYSLLILLAVAFVLLLVGVSIPGRERPMHIILVATGVVFGFIFYLVTFGLVIKKAALSPSERMFWTVAIFCLPVIGNILYIIIHNSYASKQIPKPQV